MPSVIMISVIMLECYYAECDDGKHHYDKCRYVECYYAECDDARRHYDQCRYAELINPSTATAFGEIFDYCNKFLWNCDTQHNDSWHNKTQLNQ